MQKKIEYSWGELHDNRERTRFFFIIFISFFIKLKIKGPGGVIGEEILFSDNPSYQYTTIVTSDEATFYYISKSMMYLKFPRETIEYLKGNFKIKEKIRNRVVEIAFKYIGLVCMPKLLSKHSKEKMLKSSLGEVSKAVDMISSNK